MKFIPHLIYSAAIIASVWFGCEAYKDARVAHERAETDRAQYYAVSKLYEADKAKHESITAYTNLEAKRTSVQREIRSMVIAEMKKCKKGACK